MRHRHSGMSVTGKRWWHVRTGKRAHMHEYTQICMRFPFHILFHVCVCVCVYVCTYTYACKLLPPPPLQSCPTLCDPTDGSPPGSTIPGILQARTLEWVAISFFNICICMYLKLSHFAGHQKLRQHSELIVLQFKTKKREEVEVQNGRKK